MSAPEVTAADVERLVNALTGADWLTAADLSIVLFGMVSEGNKRRIRAIASAAGAGIVSYPGSPGYKLWARCTTDELHACVAAYSSQTDDMRRRRDIYRMRLHREHPARFDRPTPEIQPSRQQLNLAI